MRHCQPLVFHATPSAAGIPCDAVSHWLTCDVVTPFKCAVLEPVWRSQKLAPPMPSLDHISGGFRTVFCLRRPSASQSDARDVLSRKRRLHFGLRCRSWRHLAIGEGCLVSCNRPTCIYIYMLNFLFIHIYMIFFMADYELYCYEFDIFYIC